MDFDHVDSATAEALIWDDSDNCQMTWCNNPHTNCYDGKMEFDEDCHFFFRANHIK